MKIELLRIWCIWLLRSSRQCRAIFYAMMSRCGVMTVFCRNFFSLFLFRKRRIRVELRILCRWKIPLLWKVFVRGGVEHQCGYHGTQEFENHWAVTSKKLFCCITISWQNQNTVVEFWRCKNKEEGIMIVAWFLKGKKAFPPPLGVLFYWLICMLCSALELLEVIANRERKVPLTAL